MENKEKKYKCPCCKSVDIKSVVTGHGLVTWITIECWMCNECGVLFRKVGKDESL